VAAQVRRRPSRRARGPHRPDAGDRRLLRAQRGRVDGAVPQDRDFRCRADRDGGLSLGTADRARRPCRAAGGRDDARTRGPSMITRREVMKWGAVAPVLLGGTHSAFAKAPQGLDALVLDRRCGSDSDGADLQAPRVYRIGGDVTALWYDVLDPVWRK